jgi:MFS transporter, OFA family, oxalate/formate antiporter
MGTCLQLCLGTVYAWSYFQKPLVEQYGWAHSQAAWAFSLAICCLGIAAAWGGVSLPKHGPRRLAVGGGALFGAGYLLAALALRVKSLPLLYIGYGVVGGTGLGLGYVTPVATAAKWFPDRKGLVTGMVIMGFGLGALLMSKFVAPMLMAWTHGNLVAIFAWLGLLFAAATMLVGSFLKNPPAGWTPGPRGASAAAATAVGVPLPAGHERDSRTVWECIRSRKFAMMWTVFFCNILAGISIISFQSPLIQDLWHRLHAGLSPAALAGYGATLIAVSSLFNGVGRLAWGALSDRIGRATAFRIMIGSQVAVFLLLMRVRSPWLFGAMICFVLFCYGGGFGTMPSFVLDTFGAKLMPSVYGTILTAWSAAGLLGPQLIAVLKDRYAEKASAYAFGISACALALGFLLACRLSDRPDPSGRS